MSDIIARGPYREIVILADLYQEQARLETMHLEIMSLLLAPQPDGVPAEQLRARSRSIALYLGDVVATETRLLKSFADGALMLEHDKTR